MKYEGIGKGIFLNRPNRFIAHVEIEGKEEICHVKNTGRCKELLTEKAEVYVEKSKNPDRKTGYSLIGVKKGQRLINMDSQAPNKVFKEWVERGNLWGKEVMIRPETVYGNSRFDFYIETEGRKIFVEVKGVTLEDNGVVRFPDAPTERGLKHVKELAQAVKNGFEAYVFFVIQMRGVLYFEPNRKTHQAFGDALVAAKKEGVGILAYDCCVTEDSIEICSKVEVRL